MVPVIKDKPKIIKIIKKKTVVIECVVISKFEPKCAWFKETNKIEESSRHKVEIQQVKEGEFAVKLEISQVVEEDKGSYKLIAKNEKGEAVSQTVELTDLPEGEEKSSIKPKIVKHLKDETFEETRSIDITVKLEKIDKKCTVKWFKNSTLINETTTIKQTFDGKIANLRISKAKAAEHTATYKCVIQNEYGQDESSANITITKVEEKKKEEEEEEKEEETKEEEVKEEVKEDKKEEAKQKKKEESKKEIKEEEKETAEQKQLAKDKKVKHTKYYCLI